MKKKHSKLSCVNDYNSDYTMTTESHLTIKEFSRLLGVSTATVSRAFNQNGRISEKTRRMILKKAEELNYRANIHARNLARPDAGEIMFFYPLLNIDEPDYFIYEIITGITGALHQQGKHMAINPYAPDSDSEFAACRHRLLDGSCGGAIIVAGDKKAIELAEAARKRSIAHVIIGHMSKMDTNSVWYDNEYGAFIAGKYFRDTKRKHPAFVGGMLDRRKRRGFQQGLGLATDEIQFIPGGAGFREGAMALETLLNSNPPADAVLCANDVLAIGLIKAARQRNIRIPEDLAVIGFDDLKVCRQLTPALSSISLNLFEIGRTAARMLLRQLVEHTCLIPSERIECDLILRESS